jgi:DNA-3-methyladenine glycosylase I
MPAALAVLSGRCHCGNIELAFESSVPAEQLPLRACVCSFCRAHGARFVGPTICYAFMQAFGMVNDHTVGCFRRAQIK